MNYGIDTEIDAHLQETVRQARINAIQIPIEYETALKIIDLGVKVDSVWNLSTMAKTFSGTCIYYPIVNEVQAISGMWMGTEDTLALEVAILPTREARYEYLKSLNYGSRGNCNIYE